VIVANQMIADDDCYFLSPNSLLKKPVRDVFCCFFTAVWGSSFSLTIVLCGSGTKEKKIWELARFFMLL